MPCKMRWLVHTCQFQAPGQVRIYVGTVIGVRGHHELPPAETEQVVLSQDSAHPFVVHLPAAASVPPPGPFRLHPSKDEPATPWSKDPRAPRGEHLPLPPVPLEAALGSRSFEPSA